MNSSKLSIKSLHTDIIPNKTQVDFYWLVNFLNLITHINDRVIIWVILGLFLLSHSKYRGYPAKRALSAMRKHGG